MDVFPAPKFVERVLTPRASEVLVARLWFGRLFSWTVALSNDELVESSLSGLRGRRRGGRPRCEWHGMSGLIDKLFKRSHGDALIYPFMGLIY